MANKTISGDIPKHVAIIMDGNGRWASKRFLPKSAGHKAGANTLKTIANTAEKLGIKYLTVYAFSTENWNRPKDEVDYLLSLLSSYISDYIADSKKNNMRFRIIGDITRLSGELQEKIKTLESLSMNKTGLQLIFAINYGAKDELVRAVKSISKAVHDGSLSIDNIKEETIAKFLDTQEIPEPELLIRTSGELRLSNFMLWQLAYTELYFTDTLWPDFKPDDLTKAIESFKNRDRRFGAR